MIRSLLLCCVMLLLGAVLAGAQTFDAAALAKSMSKSGALVDDADAGNKQAFELSAAMDFGYAPQVQAGLYRLELRLKRTVRANGQINLFVSSGNWNQSPYYREDPAPITSNELPDLNTWYVITRQVRFAGIGYWGGVTTGGWKGLRIDYIRLRKVEEPVMLLNARAEKLLYRLNEPGKIRLTLVNTTADPQAVTLAVEARSGLTDVRQLAPVPFTLPAVTPEQRLARQDSTTTTVPLPPLAEYGNAITVTVRQGDRVLGSLTDYCYASNRPAQLGQYYGWRFPDDYTCSTEQNLEEMRRIYFPIAECFFWAPCDNSMQAPDSERWWSGQTLMRLSKTAMRDMITTGHAQGMTFISYATRWGFGQRMWEFGRRYPDLVEWDVPGFQLSYNVAHLERERAEVDAEHKDLGSTGILTAAWGNPESVAAHVKQLQASMKMLGWDGFRYDNGSPVIDEVQDIYGRALPLPGWTHAKTIAALRDGPRQVKPGAIYGNNTGWNLQLDSQPHPDDYYTQQVKDGGIIMQESTNAWQGPFTTEANNYFRAGYNATRFGGYQYNILNPYMTGPDHIYQVAITAAGGCHICYRVREEAIPIMQMICRHSDLFYGDGLRFILNPADTLRVDNAPNVLWRDYARYYRLSPTKRIYFVHLINPPPGANLGGSGGLFPEPVANVTATWTLPAGWRAQRAWHITADGGYRQEPLPLAGDAPRVTLPLLQTWSIVAIEAEGPELAESPWPPPATADAKPGTASTDLTGAATVATGGIAAAPMLHYLPDQGLTQPYTLPLAGFTRVPGAQAITDADALQGKALRVGAQGIRNEIGYGPGIAGPGKYRFVLRAKTLAPPPANARLSAFVSSANNNATPGAKYLRNDFSFSAADFPQVGQWVELATDLNMSYLNYWGGLDGGWDGLVLDRLTITRVRSFTKAEALTTLESLWPAELNLTPHAGKKVWYGAGLYYDLYRLDTACKALGITPEVAKAWRYRGPAGLDGAPFPKTPQELAGYDLIVITDMEARMLAPQQLAWLDEYVKRGGHLLLLGGPYAYGCGGWEDNPLVNDLLPVTLHRHDLKKVGAAPLQPQGVLVKTIDWSKNSPVAVWLHQAAPKPGATVLMTANGAPAIVTGAYGKGKVTAVLAAPLGDAPAGKTAFWNAPAWPTLMTVLVNTLLQ